MTYKVYKTDGRVVGIERWKPLELDDMQGLIGGVHLQMMTLHDGRTLVFDEDGMKKNLPRNPHFLFIVGDVLEGKIKDEEFVAISVV